MHKTLAVTNYYDPSVSSEGQLTLVPTYVNFFDNNSMHNRVQGSRDKDHTRSSTFIGPGLPAHLVEKIRSGEFVELAELLPDHIASLSGG